MRKILMLIMIFIVGVTSVSAEYISNNDYCAVNPDGIVFVADCPHDHRVDGDWFKVRHYLNETGESKCIDGELIQDACEFEILPWNHPNVVGASSSEQKTAITKTNSVPNDNEIPEFGVIGTALALLGGALVYFKIK